MTRILFIGACALALAACASLNGKPPTAASCNTAQAELTAAQHALPPLVNAVTEALQANGGDKSAKAVQQAQAAVDIAEALIAADQALVSAQCAAVPPGP